MEKISCRLMELHSHDGVKRPVGAQCLPTSTSSLLHSRPVSLAATLGRFSSSLLPPLFPPGRCAAIFIQRGVAHGGTPLSFASRGPA